MRLIDADALKKAIPNTHVDIFENCRNCRLLDDEQVKQLIDDTPTIELLKEQEAVVRCKDCKNRGTYSCFRILEDEDGEITDLTFDDGFCDSGERRE